MLVTNGNGFSTGFRLVNASRNEFTLAVKTLDTVRVPCRVRGKLKQRTEELVADKPYDSKSFMRWLRCRGSD